MGEVVVGVDPLADHGAGPATPRSRTSQDVKALPRVDDERKVLTKVAGSAVLVGGGAHVDKDWDTRKAHRPVRVRWRGWDRRGPRIWVTTVQLAQNPPPPILIVTGGVAPGSYLGSKDDDEWLG